MWETLHFAYSPLGLGPSSTYLCSNVRLSANSNCSHFVGPSPPLPSPLDPYLNSLSMKFFKFWRVLLATHEQHFHLHIVWIFLLNVVAFLCFSLSLALVRNVKDAPRQGTKFCWVLLQFLWRFCLTFSHSVSLFLSIQLGVWRMHLGRGSNGRRQPRALRAASGCEEL